MGPWSKTYQYLARLIDAQRLQSGQPCILKDSGAQSSSPWTSAIELTP